MAGDVAVMELRHFSGSTAEFVNTMSFDKDSP